MLFQRVSISKLSFAFFAYPVGEPGGRDVRFDVRVVDFVDQVLVESLLVNKIPVAIASVTQFVR
jgi:hypothetical protein